MTLTDYVARGRKQIAGGAGLTLTETESWAKADAAICSDGGSAGSIFTQSLIHPTFLSPCKTIIYIIYMHMGKSWLLAIFHVFKTKAQLDVICCIHRFNLAIFTDFLPLRNDTR